MEKPKAFVSKKKKEEVKKIKSLLEKHPVLGLADITGLPSPQLQKIRLNLREKLLIRITKIRLISLVLSDLKNIPGIEKLKGNLTGMPALLFSKEDPFKLAKLLLRSKSSAPARAGQVAPKDIVINAGPTSFVPGPIIGELGAAGLKTSVEGGKIVIKEDKIVANKGEVITSKVADLLNKFKIEPMEVGLKILALYENGVVYGGDVLNIEDSVYIDNVKKAYNEAFSLAIEAGYIVKETVEHLIKKAELEAKAIAKETKVFASESVGDVIKEAEGEALALKEKIPEVKEENKEEMKFEEKKQEVKEEIKEETKAAVVKKTESAENIVDEIIQRAQVEGLKPEEEKTKIQRGPSEEDIRKTESFVKNLVGGGFRSEDLGKSASQLKKEREEQKKKKEKAKKEFEDAEKAAQDILNKV